MCDYRDVVQVLAHLLRRGHHVPLGDPLLQFGHLSAEQEVVVGVVQLLPAVLGQLPQPGVLLVHLALPPDDLLAADRGRQGRPSQKKSQKIGRRGSYLEVEAKEISVDAAVFTRYFFTLKEQKKTFI